MTPTNPTQTNKKNSKTTPGKTAPTTNGQTNKHQPQGTGMKTLQTYWPKMSTPNKALLTLQALYTAITAIILIVNPTWPKAAMLAISTFTLCIITALTITQTRRLADQAKDTTNA